MKKDNYILGALGERLSVRYLQSKGFEVIDQNVHLGKYAEIDIVAMKNSVVHFVEVKTSSADVHDAGQVVFPIYNITPRKIRHLSIGSEMYIRNNHLENLDRTIDAIGVVINPASKKSYIRFFPNILEGVI